MNLLPNIPKIDNHQIDTKSLFSSIKDRGGGQEEKRKGSDKESEARVNERMSKSREKN